ncbi:ATP-binding protein [Frateuria aurantia]|uniref:histidine kinase n=1 Tax=Frateuria aurantia (strain ATCC 33424 / DSM 6220 / KCTC 2777 / LMG 1558 / NBRC 3245 / NCIMB 13370) TaxID=767434 RepID=H8KZJ1_FRAAD|nr:ATP-binding protein [Frateuria aurantia]AFC87051.1 signal transduction histidine kinase [Frateuria aurantia DSM 6220]
MRRTTWSLHSRLSWMIAGMLALVLMPLGIYSFKRTVGEVAELSDGRLAQAARTQDTLADFSLRPADHTGAPILIPTRAVEPTRKPPRKTYETEVGFQWFDPAGKLQVATDNMAGLALPAPQVTGYQNIWLDHYRWRIFNLQRSGQRGWIRVAERYDSRHTILRALWFDHSMPLLFGLPLLAVLVGWAVRRGLRPLDQLTRSLQQRTPGSREPMPHMPLPAELQPVIDALDDMLERLDGALERERHFSADVAHELRTPLAATTLHLENAMQTRDPAWLRGSLASAHHALNALSRRVEQLLALARLESGVATAVHVPVNLTAVTKDVLDEFGPLLLESGIDVSFHHPGRDLLIDGYEAAINALIRNLVENAMRHTPVGGEVQLRLDTQAGSPQLEVIDSGPGIPAHLRERMFERFERVPGQHQDGLGLGLSLVRRAAQMHGASIDLLDRPEGSGLRVRVRFPPPSSCQAGD